MCRMSMQRTGGTCTFPKLDDGSGNPACRGRKTRQKKRTSTDLSTRRKQRIHNHLTDTKFGYSAFYVTPSPSAPSPSDRLSANLAATAKPAQSSPSTGHVLINHDAVSYPAHKQLTDELVWESPLGPKLGLKKVIRGQRAGTCRPITNGWPAEKG